jgi:hypothetical protein
MKQASQVADRYKAKPVKTESKPVEKPEIKQEEIKQEVSHG